MPVWISQRSFPSATPVTLGRTRYLDHLKPGLQDTVHNYFVAHRLEHEVTLACLRAVGLARAQTLARNHRRGSLDSVKKDLGLLVPILLSQMYDPNDVETLRRETTNRNVTSPRPDNWTDLHWVSKYTPHRLVLRAK